MHQNSRRVYLCGAVDNPHDLGIGWRRKAAEALLRVGLEPVWPLDLYELHRDQVTVDDVRRSWRDRIEISQRYGYDHPMITDCQIMGSCAGVLVYWTEDAGTGTWAEVAMAEAMGLPIAGIEPGHTMPPVAFSICQDAGDDFSWAAQCLARKLEAIPCE